MPYTPEEVAMLLNLRPYNKFRLEKLRYYLSEEYIKACSIDSAVSSAQQLRATGRTTWMMCQALSKMSQKQFVAILGRTNRHTLELHRTMQELADKLSINHDYLVYSDPIRFRANLEVNRNWSHGDNEHMLFTQPINSYKYPLIFKDHELLEAEKYSML